MLHKVFASRFLERPVCRYCCNHDTWRCSNQTLAAEFRSAAHRSTRSVLATRYIIDKICLHASTTLRCAYGLDRGASNG
jgi:hypothetical protein